MISETPINQMLAPSSAPRSRLIKQGLAYALALLMVRFIQLAAIGWLTGGSEFADDIRFQRIYASDPLQLLLGRSTTYEVFPPLFPTVLWAIHTPLSWILSPFYSMRATMCVIELLAWPLLWSIIVLVATGRQRHLLAITYIVAPICWVSSVIMCQDEVISLVVFSAVTLALLKNWNALAILFCGIGVVVAKIYFLVPLVGLIGIRCDRTWGIWLRDVFVGVAPILVVYGIQAMLSGDKGGGATALGDFDPPIEMSINLWALIKQFVEITPQQAKHLSSILALGLSMVPLVAIWARGKPSTSHERVQTIVAMMMWVYLAFYHINPEYYLIIVPGIIVVFRPIIASAITCVLFSLPWAVNFFYGIRVGKARDNTGRGPFVRIYDAIFPLEPATWQLVCIALFAVAATLLAVVLSWSLYRPTTATGGSAISVRQPQAVSPGRRSSSK